MTAQQDPGVPGVAIVGLSGRFPGAGNPSQFWANLRAGRESITIVTEELHGSTAAPTASRDARDVHARGAGRLDDVTAFDAAFFGMSVATAAAIDPQGRLFLECAWEAFEHSGYVGERVEGPVAVFAAPGPRLDPVRRVSVPRPAALTPELARNRIHDQDGLAALVSSELNLTGPSLDLRTAGASSLAAVHLACQSLLNGECDMALAGGATVHADDQSGGGSVPPADVRCRPFDAAASGAVAGSAVACVVLKRLEDAWRDGDHILAVIRGSAINYAGARHAGDPAARLTAQVRAVSEALAIAGVTADQVSVVEAHAAGTPGDDAMEIRALTRTFRAQTTDCQFCAVGSVKGNIGHAGEAAGIASLVKVVLALQHREIPASLHVERLNPDAHFEDSPFYVNTNLREWATAPGRRRIAGVSAMGEGGSNVHLLLEEAPESPPPAPSRDRQLVVLSAHTPAALDRATDSLAAWLRATPEASLADVAYTLLDGRKPLPYRRVVVATNAADAVDALEAANGRQVNAQASAGLEPTVVWMFSGGEAFVGMGLGLYASEPIYRRAVDEAIGSLEAVLAAEVNGIVAATRPLTGTTEPVVSPSRALPALVAVEYGVGRLLQDWGITPAALIGDGPGEYVAACFAGVFDIRQAMAMAVFEGRFREARVVAAPASAVDPGLDDVDRFCRTLNFQAPTGRLISSVTGGWVTDADSEYWRRRLQQRCGRTLEGLTTLRGLGDPLFLDIGPDRSLMKVLEAQPGPPAVVTAALARSDDVEPDLAVLLGAVGRLWAAGVKVSASRLFAGERRRRVALPAPPFERQPLSVVLDAQDLPLVPASRVPLPDLRRELAGMWSDVLERDEVASDDDFFELGGHSLAAVRLFGKIRAAYGVDLPLGLLVESPTIDSFAPRLQARLAGAAGRGPAARAARPAGIPSPSMVAVQAGGGGVPLFVVHGAGGNVVNIRDLARALGPTQAVFGLQAAGIDGIGQPGTTIEQMAQDYLDDVRAVQPRGPYLLAGYSGGGVIAFEMARRLRAEGEAIGVLAFIDTFHPQMPTPRINTWTRLARLRLEGAAYVRDGLIRTWQSFVHTRAARRLDAHLAAGEPVPPALRELHLIRSFKQAARRYVPPPWPGNALLFKAEQVDYYDSAGGPTYGWDSAIQGGIEIVPVPGDHSSIMVGTNAARIAARLGQALADVNAAANQDRDG